MHLENNNYINYFKYSFLLLPFALISGPFIPDLIVSIGAIFCLFNLKKIFKVNNCHKNKVILFIIFFNFYLFINSIITNSYTISLTTTLFYCRFLFFILLFAYIFKISDLSKLFFYSLFYAFTFIVFDSLFQHFFDKNIFGFEKVCVRDCEFENFKMLRLTGPFKGEAIVGSYLVRLLPLLLGIYFISFYKKFNIFILSLLILLVTLVVFISGERTSFFYLLTIFFILFLTLKTDSGVKFKFFSLISIFLFFILVMFSEARFRMINFTLIQAGIKNDVTVTDNVIKSVKENYIINSNKNEKINKLNSNSKFVVFSNQHMSHYYVAIEMFKENFLFGHGVKSFRHKCKDYQYSEDFFCNTHPHNIPLQFLAELGIVGFVLYFLLLVTIIWIFAKQFFNIYFINNNKLISNGKICFLVSIFINLFPFSPSGNFFNNWISIFLYLPVIFILKYDDK
jgi:O-antigen ligase